MPTRLSLTLSNPPCCTFLTPVLLFSTGMAARQDVTRPRRAVRPLLARRGLCLGVLLFFVGYAQAQARDGIPFCERYARAAVEQQAANTARGCGFQGARWSSDYQGHHAWCLGVDGNLAETEQRERDKALHLTCASAEAPPVAPLPPQVPSEQIWKPEDATAGNPPLLVDPAEIWESIDVSAGQQPAIVPPNAMHDASTFVKISNAALNACKNTVRITRDRSGPFWKGEVSATLLGDGTNSSGAFTTGSVATVHLSTLEHDDTRTPGPKNMELLFKLRTADGPWLDASNPPYFVTLNRYRQPAVLSVVPSTVSVGTTAVVTITGRDFITPGQQTTVRLLSIHVGTPTTKVLSLTPTMIKLQVTVPPGMAPDEYMVQVAKRCAANIDSPRLRVVKPPSAPPPTPSAPAEKEVLVRLNQQPAPPAGGNVPYVGSILPVSGGVLQSISNGNTYLGKQWGVRLVKAGYTTNDCNNATAVVDLPPGKTTTDFQGTALGSGLPLAACIYAVSVATPPPASLALKVRYRK